MNPVEKMNKQSTILQIEGIISTAIGFLPKEHKKQIEDVLKNLLPVIKDFAKKKLQEFSDKLGSGADKKFYVLQNINGSPELWIMPKNKMKAFDGEPTLEFPLEKIIERIDKHETLESLIADVISMQIFSIDEESEQI